MESEILNAMKEDMHLSMLLIEIIVLITVLLTIAGIAWLCFEEIRQSVHRRINPAPQPPEPAEADLLALLPRAG
jgi:hypothetical protein